MLAHSVLVTDRPIQTHPIGWQTFARRVADKARLTLTVVRTFRIVADHVRSTAGRPVRTLVPIRAPLALHRTVERRCRQPLVVYADVTAGARVAPEPGRSVGTAYTHITRLHQITLYRMGGREKSCVRNYRCKGIESAF